MSDRAQRLADLLPKAEVELLLVTELINVRYLTGFTGTNALALVGPGRRMFATDFRYVEQAAAEVEPSYERRRCERELFDQLADALPAGALRLGFDDTHLTVRQHAHLRELLPDRVELVAAGELVERLRAVKEPGEITRIRAASALADAALTKLLELGLVGRTERALADALETIMRDAGATGPSFRSIVASGPHAALPHAEPRDVAVEPGQLVVIDWGAVLDGYCSDCTRTVATGPLSDADREIYELVLAAQLTGLEAVRVGVGGRDADAAARAVIEAAGRGDQFGHSLGHGVGLEVHEAPNLSTRSESELAPGNVVTVEPGVYVPGRLGVRIEDLVVVGEPQNEILTSLDKRLTIVR